MLRDEVLKFFSNYIEAELGIVYAEHNHYQLEHRLEEIAKVTGSKSIEDLYERLKNGISGHVKQLLLDSATNNETSFFRDPKVFAAIEEAVLKKYQNFVEQREKLRIWSAASSTGQEALSIAILVKEYNEKNHTAIDLRILGTDISDRVLERAQSGIYNQIEMGRGLSELQITKYFQNTDKNQWQASFNLTQHIEFKKFNLKSSIPLSEKFHIILCRNMLIYQSVEGKKEILNRITTNLMPGGFLILGAGESLMGLSSDYEQSLIAGAMLYQKKGVLSKAA